MVYPHNSNNNKQTVIARTPPQPIKTIGGGGGGNSGNSSNSSNSIMLSSSSSSPTTQRLRSPRGTLSPRKISKADSYLFIFLRNTKGIVTVLAIVAFFTILHRPDYLNDDDDANSSVTSSSVTSAYYSNIPDITEAFDFFPSVLTNNINNPVTETTTTNDDDDVDVVDDDGDVNVIGNSNEDNNDDDVETDSTKFNTGSPEDSTTVVLVGSEEELQQKSSKSDINVAVVVDDHGDDDDDDETSLKQRNQKLLSSYNATKHPVFSRPQTIQVHLIVDVSRVISPPSKFLLDGLERSQHIRLLALTFLNPRIKTVEINNRSKKGQPMVYMVDWGSMNRDCHRLQRVLQHLKHNPKKDKLVLMDLSAGSRQTQCDYFHNDDKNVKIAKRGIIEGRVFDFQHDTILPGRVLDNPHGNIVHAPLVLREKFMDVIQNISSDIVNVDRSIDVAFYWKNGDYSHYGFHRRNIGRVVKRLHHSNTDNNHTVEAFVGIAANDQELMVEGNVQLEYVQKLVSSKIVVIAQRDEWEDHYRLMESLASGALVMTDPMLAKPAGLKNKTNILIYENPTQLKKLIRYYLKNDEKRLAIAKKGYELAAGRHRAWHRIEEVLFGRPLTHVDVPYQRLEKQKRPKTKLVVEDPIFTRR